MKDIIAVFDFDGTITRRDTLNDLIICNFGVLKFALEMFKLSPIILLYKLGVFPNEKPKQKLFSHFFKKMKEEKFNDICRKYSLERIDNILRKSTLEKIKWHKKSGHKLIIISASTDRWIKPWAEKEGFSDIICTDVEVKEGLITGSLKGKNCYGREKAERFLKKYPERNEYYLYAYGDSRGDRELLKIADKGELVR